MPRKKAETVEEEKKPKKKASKKKPEFDENLTADGRPISKRGKIGRKNLDPAQSKEEAKKRGRNGGVKSGEVRRAKKDARESVRYLLGLAAKGNLKANLTDLGLPENEQTNMAALQARLFTMAMGGNLDAYKELMKIAGFDVDDNRKDRELDAKIAAISNNPEARVSLGLGSEDTGGSDVVIYLPEIEPIPEDNGMSEGTSTENPQETPDQE